jgi:hypothetical protein
VGAVIFIVPRQWKTALDVLHVLLHEMLHAALPAEVCHGAPFARRARAIGLEGPPSATVPGTPLRLRLEALAADVLAPFPGAAFDLPQAGGGAVGSRLRLWECACKVKVRVASDAFNAVCNDCCRPFERRFSERKRYRAR